MLLKTEIKNEKINYSFIFLGYVNYEFQFWKLTFIVVNVNSIRIFVLFGGKVGFRILNY